MKNQEIIEELQLTDRWLPEYDKKTNWYREYLRAVFNELKI